MKKIININFHGRVVPIEETAYDILNQYVESLRKYFANEEGRDEIINDIENRFAELFSERLKKDATCITDADVNSIIASMGRPEDFEAADVESGPAPKTDQQNTSSAQQQSQRSYSYTTPPSRGRLYRNADDKILGGVCSGLANYLGIDPVILRIVFVVLIGALFWVYILLWIVVPSQSQQSNITKRLYRSANDKVIAGVAGGLAAYFNIQAWIPRLIFALPFVLGLVSGVFHAAFWDYWDFAPRFISGGLGSTLIISYIILWIAVPVATTASEKLEMRGERVDLNSIANTIKEDLEGFKGKAEKLGNDIKQGAQKFGTEVGNIAQEKSRDLSYEISQRRSGTGIGHVIGILFKAFFLFIAGIVAVALFGALIGLLFGGFAVFPFKNFFLSGATENFLAWLSLLLFLGIPLIAILTWLVRRIMGVRSKNHYLGFVFGGLWVIGLISMITLISMFARNFRTRDYVEDNVSIVQPANGKIYVGLTDARIGNHYFPRRWDWSDWDNDWPIFGDNYDSLLLNTVRLDIVKSKDSQFHVERLRSSRGKSSQQAQGLAEKINFNIQQQDSLLLLPRGGFAISKNDKFRNQQVLVVIEVPVGKKIEVNNNVENYRWFNIHVRRNGWNINDDDDDWDGYLNDRYHWTGNVEYVMTEHGLERTDKKWNENNEEDDQKTITPKSGKGYRYKADDSLKRNYEKDSAPKKDSALQQKSVVVVESVQQVKTNANVEGEASSPAYFLSLLLQS
ncbi:MAG TPA: PspC domain-containing protein [Puia sp.]|nr:PspC domain-containing protein [Puia sp.]